MLLSFTIEKKKKVGEEANKKKALTPKRAGPEPHSSS